MTGCASSATKMAAIFTRQSSQSLGPGRARAFESASTDYLSASHTIGAETTFSMAAWIKISNTAGLARVIMGLFSSDENDTGYFFMQLTTGGVLRAMVYEDSPGSGTFSDFGSTDLRDGEWHLVACWRDGSNLTVSVDGANGTSDAETRTFPTIDTVAVGCRVDQTPDQPFEGDIDECSLWEGTKITDANVASLWAIGNNSRVGYLSSFGSEGVTTPTHHWSLSVDKASVGADEIGSVDLTDNGTADVEGIPAGD